MVSLLLRNLLFTILQPGLVAGLLPYLLLGNKQEILWPAEWMIINYVAAALFISGLIILLNCIYRFAKEGRGTLSPVDPTKKLFVTGLYRFSRNPMYIGVMLILVAEAVFLQRGSLWIYLTVVFFLFNLFIALHEEPRLRRVFGDDYAKYCGKVRRWL